VARRILYVLGTPPNFLKVAALLGALRRRLPHVRHVLVNTDQDHDPSLSEVLQEVYDLPEAHYLLGAGSGGPVTQAAFLMDRLERVIDLERPDLVIVPGDADSTLAATLAAVRLGVPTAHIESGLRSFERNSPDEVNRIVADEFADLRFAYSDDAVENLLRQGIPGDRVHLVGNTKVDALIALDERFREPGAATRFGVQPGGYLLVALYGSKLLDRPIFWDILDRLKRISRELPVLFPMSFAARRRLEAQPAPKATHIVDPPGYLDLLSLQADSAAVLTNFGEVQEEANYLGVPCFTLRGVTERGVTLEHGTNTLLGSDPSRISDILPALQRRRPSPERLPLWDGHASERAANVVEGVLEAEEWPRAEPPRLSPGRDTLQLHALPAKRSERGAS
jgi:UDP-N-acetylglucosamine 2-epimerase (non-hydrolysing)